VLGLFPSFAETGGIQVSGQVAWMGIQNGIEPEIQEAYLFSYGHAGTDSKEPRAVHCRSRLAAALYAWRLRRPVRLVLVWHIGLLRLLPFFRLGEARTAVVLHGIEAWKPVDWLTRALIGRVDLWLSDSAHTWQRFVAANPGCARRPHRTVHLGLSTALPGECGAPDARPRR
jgi:hypothetical protein